MTVKLNKEESKAFAKELIQSKEPNKALVRAAIKRSLQKNLSVLKILK